MIVIASKYLVPKGYTAITLFPFIFLHDNKLKEDAILINHEQIHLRQQAELLIIFFYLWYAIEYVFRLLKCKNHGKAYHNISFEREAYTHETDSNYLKNRKLWSFIKFT